MKARFDPRLYQIAVLSGLLLYGWARLDFDITPARAALLIGACLGGQLAWTVMRRLPAFDARSALISALSLCLLFRANDPLLAVAAALVAISSKFLARVHGKHIFNPTNIGLAVMLLLTDAAWVSPGQWGNPAWFAFLMACFGFLVVTRAARADVTLAFLAFYATLIAGRSFWLGEPAAIPIHRLQSGALLLFAFFMISDPKTTPDSRAGRVVFAALVASGAWYVQFRLFRTNGLIWSLAGCSLFVPVLDRWLPGSRYAWPARLRGFAASSRQPVIINPQPSEAINAPLHVFRRARRVSLDLH
jgi:Na+-transporting NADH:ubiquinone oxidoreductase subunit NqrB